MDSLPLELTTEIFRLSQEDLEDMKDWYSLRLVDPDWTVFIDHCPVLWRRVDTAAGPDFVDKQLERARGMRLWVQADASERGTYDRAWVEGHRDVIERLTLFVASGKHHDDVDIASDILGAGHFPNLRHFRIRRQGVSGGRSISLPNLPDTFVDPLALTHLEFTGISYSIPALTFNSNICFLRLNYENSSFPIALAELQALLPLLPLLDDLLLGGSLETGTDDAARPPSTLSSLTRFSFFGKVEDLDHLLRSFMLPAVDHWHFRVRVGKDGIPATCRLRSIVRGWTGLLVKVVLRWLSKSESMVKLVDGTSPPRFSLKLLARRGAPLQTLSSLLQGVGELPAVRHLDLHGGATYLDVFEPDDEVIDNALAALRNVEDVTVSGNGNSWVRVPVVLHRRLGQGDDLWSKVETLRFSMGVMLPYTVRDWTYYLRGVRQQGRLLPVLKLRGWKIETGSHWECDRLAEDLEELVEMMDGELGMSNGVYVIR